jgi:tetratricopeptide (TPR) repeat protein
LFLRKVGYTLNRAFLTLNYSYPFYRDESPALRALVVGPFLLVPVGLVGLFAFRIRGDERPAGYVVFATVLPLLILSIAVFFVAERYRIPLLVVLCVTSGALVDALIRTTSERRMTPFLATLACVFVVGAFAVRDLKLDDARAEEETRMAVWLVSNGRGGEAEERLSRIRRDHPLLGVAHFRVGQAFASAGRPGDAALHYEQAVKIDPKEPAPRAALARVSGELGIALAQQGQDAEALRHLTRAAQLTPDEAPAQLNLAVQLARMERFGEARAAAERALELDPAYARARGFLAALDKAGK